MLNVPRFSTELPQMSQAVDIMLSFCLTCVFCSCLFDVFGGSWGSMKLPYSAKSALPPVILNV